MIGRSRHARGRGRERLHGAISVALILAIAAAVAYLGGMRGWRGDWTAAARNTLSDTSAAVLARLPERVDVDAYVREAPLHRQAIRELVDRYQQVHPGLRLRFVNPDRVPDEARRLGVRGEGELIVRVGDRSERVGTLDEATLTNALHRLARGDTRWVAALEASGSRAWRSDTPFDLGVLTGALEDTGFAVRPVSLGPEHPAPDNAAVLAVTEGTVAFDDAVIDAVEAHLERGGNLLWLADPGDHTALARIGARIGIAAAPGVVVDPASADPGFVTSKRFGTHPVTSGLDGPLTFPLAAGLTWERREGWAVTGLVSTGLRAWAESHPEDGPVGFDPDADVRGPLDLAVAAERRLDRPTARGDWTQRVVVIGDADFASDRFAGAGANLEFGLRALAWLAHDDALVDIPPRTAPDVDFAPGPVERAVIALGPPLLLPVLYLVVGAWTWRKRRA